jgi:hypothetical protein
VLLCYAAALRLRVRLRPRRAVRPRHGDRGTAALAHGGAHRVAALALGERERGGVPPRALAQRALLALHLQRAHRPAGPPARALQGEDEELAAAAALRAAGAAAGGGGGGGGGGGRGGGSGSGGAAAPAVDYAAYVLEGANAWRSRRKGGNAKWDESKQKTVVDAVAEQLRKGDAEAAGKKGLGFKKKL